MNLDWQVLIAIATVVTAISTIATAIIAIKLYRKQIPRIKIVPLKESTFFLASQNKSNDAVPSELYVQVHLRVSNLSANRITLTKFNLSTKIDERKLTGELVVQARTDSLYSLYVPNLPDPDNPGKVIGGTKVGIPNSLLDESEIKSSNLITLTPGDSKVGNLLFMMESVTDREFKKLGPGRITEIQFTIELRDDQGYGSREKFTATLFTSDSRYARR